MTEVVTEEYIANICKELSRNPHWRQRIEEMQLIDRLPAAVVVDIYRRIYLDLFQKRWPARS
jgi:hypothetical protein